MQQGSQNSKSPGICPEVSTSSWYHLYPVLSNWKILNDVRTGTCIIKLNSLGTDFSCVWLSYSCSWLIMWLLTINISCSEVQTTAVSSWSRIASTHKANCHCIPIHRESIVYCMNHACSIIIGAIDPDSTAKDCFFSWRSSWISGNSTKSIVSRWYSTHFVDPIGT